MPGPDDFEMPLAKRQRFDQPDLTKPRTSRLFAPFRTIGLVSPTVVPFTSVPLGSTSFQITTSLGRSLHTYDLRKGLSLVFLSRPQCPQTISATYAYRDRVFVAWGNGTSDQDRGVWVFRRGKLIGELETVSTSAQEIKTLLVFGNWIVGCGEKALEVWKSDTYEHYTTITPSSHRAKASQYALTGHICSLPTFLNKIFVGRTDGNVEVYNISTGKLVHTVAPSSSTNGSVTALSSAPSISLIAIAYSDGSVAIHDIEMDETLLQLGLSDHNKAVTCITFRTDGVGAGEDGRSDGVMATASIESGDVTFWDLNSGGRMVGKLRGAHDFSITSTKSGITKIEFLPGQPVIVSAGLDNALKSWVFDQNPFSTIPRILHLRSGHSAPTTQLKFLPAASDGSDASGKWLLSASYDHSLWGFSLRKDGQSTELSQGNVRHKAKKSGQNIDGSRAIEDFKAPPIISIACSLNRDGGIGAVGGPVWTNPKASNAEEASMTGWESVVTAHKEDKFARTWFWGRKKAGRWALETGDHQPVSSVAITGCGTFALVGSTGGSLDMYNLQSGMHRQRFPPKIKPATAKQMKIQQISNEGQINIQRGHRGSISGIVVDNLNQTIVSTGHDGIVIFWDFSSGNVIEKLSFDSAAPTAMRYNPVSGLVAISCDDLCIRVIDMETRRVVRELWGCVGQIYDHCFSHDGRWIVACSMDSVIRVFDLATGHMIDAFRTATCTNVAFSSTGEYLATAHAGAIGINIWNNKSLFTHVPSRQIDEEQGIIDLSGTTAFDAGSQLAIQDDKMQDEVDLTPLTDGDIIDQLDSSLLTLSLVPQSRWQTLLNLETIRQRNKPIQPPEKPKAAPFFLGSTLKNGNSASEKSINGTKELQMIAEDEQSRISRLASFENVQSTLSDKLRLFDIQPIPQPEEVINYLASLSPSATDLDIRSLTLDEMPTFVAALSSRLEQKRDFELVNTWMSVFLRVHSEFVSGVPEIRKQVLRFQKIMEEEESRLGQAVGWARGVVDYLRSVR